MALGVVGLKAEPASNHPPPEPWQIAGIQAAMKDASPQVRAAAAAYSGARYWSRQCLTMDDLLPLLQDPDRWVKIAAHEGLNGMGPELTPATAEALVNVLLDESSLQAVGRLGPEAAPLVMPRVLPLLEKADAAMKLYVVDVLLQMGQDAAPYAQALLPLLPEADAELQECILRTLKEMDLGQARPPNVAEAAPAVARALLPLLKDADPVLRSAVMSVLGTLGLEAAPLVLPVLDDEATSGEWAWNLIHLGKAAAPAVAPLLLPRLRHAERRMRFNAMSILSFMGPAAAPYAADILPLLKDPDDGTRYFAASALAELGAGSATYFKDMFPLLRDVDPDVQTAAIDALVKMGPKTAPQVVKALLPLLSSTHHVVRRKLEEAFVLLRPQALPMVGVLAPALRKADARMQIAIIGALCPSLADATAMPCIRLLRPYLQDREIDIRRTAAKVLACIGTGPEAAAFIQKEVLPMLKDPDPSVRSAVVEGLSVTGDAPQLLPLLRDSEGHYYDSVVYAFERMGEKAATYAKNFIPLVEGRHSRAGRPVFDLFRSMGPSAAPVLLPALLPLLTQPTLCERGDVLSVLDPLGNVFSDPAWQCAALAAAHTIPAGMDGAGEIAHAQADHRFHLYLWSGHDPALLLSVRWLGRLSDDPMPAAGLSAAEQQAVLGMLLKLWPHSAPYSALRREMAGRILSVAQSITAAPDEAVTTLLQKLSAELKADAVEDSREASAKASAAVQGALAGKSKLAK